MSVVYHYGALLFLAALSSAGPVATPNAGCTYSGRKYKNMDTIPHKNGCATLQCQFGKVDTYYEACGKEVDGKCHRVNMMYLHKGTTYECRKVLVGQNYEYKNEVAIPVNADCVEGRQRYKHLEKFTRSGGCQVYQCLSGQSFPLNEGCGETIDGKCHLVGELYTKGRTTYNCTTRETNSVTLFVNTPLTTSRSTRPCVKSGATYNDLEIFRLAGSCTVYQCQDRAIKTLAIECSFRQDQGKCYAIGEGWTFGENTYECTLDEQGNPKINLAIKGFQRCKRSERWYNHLDIIPRPDGCVKVQCQDGKTPPVEEACAVPSTKECQQLNFVWQQGSVTLKCILTGDGLYRIVELDEFGKIIEKTKPVLPPPTFEETCPELLADIIFVWDSSGSMSRANFLRQLNFSCDIASAFKVGPNHVQFGGVVFSDAAEKVFDLKTNDNYQDICRNILSTPYLGDVTETQKAFAVILQEGMFLPDAGGRTDAPKIVIVITDGASTNTSKTVAAAGQIKALGVQMISVGVGQISFDELRGIASRPENVFTIENYAAIFALRQQVAERACKSPIDPPIIPEETIPPKCPNTVADIIFILDSSNIGAENYQTKLNLAVNMTSMFTVSPKFVQIGSVLVSTQPKTAFNLNTHSRGSAVAKALKEAEYLKGDKELDDAIESIINQGLYTTAKGGRDRAARIAVILIDGPPTNWARTLSLAKRLRNEGVRVVTIGIGNIPMKKLTGLSGNSEYVFASPSYELLKFTKELMYQTLCEATKLPRPDPEPPRCTDTEVPPCDQICTNTETGFVCSCNTGYLVNKQNKSKCDDKNECTDRKLCEQLCENTVGSYLCLCEKGFTVSPNDPSKCLDVDECESNPCQNTCTNTVGSYRCTCNDGYQVSPTDPAICLDIDECKESTPCQQVCNNTEGSYTCGCKPGYVVSPTDPTKCDDVDECKESSPCEQTCTNTDGSYTCSCKPGYVVSPTDPTKCNDVDQCKESSPCEQTCTNTVGSFTCSCKPGYVVSPTNPTKCDDVDECKESSPCKQTCTNTVGSFTCSCRPGYVVSPTDPTKCGDVDECKESSPCEQTCTNTVGSFKCSCRPGYVVSPTDPTKCGDVDECKESSPCEQTCTNTVGSFTCSCRPGYVVSPTDPTKCGDVDECKESSPCEQTCTNKVGSFTCSCKPGYVVSPTGPTKCDDVDECLDEENPPCHHKCTNTEGSFTCSCRKGYVPNDCDPNSCRDVNECEEDLCDNECTNTRGGYICS